MSQRKKAHLIGICGVGMSATALILKDLGWEISGSDADFYPPISTYLKKAGIPFHTSYTRENIPPDADVIVVGKNARLVPEENEEVKAAFESGKTIRSFPEVLEGLVADTRNLVVAGSFGKTTTAALLAWCLKEAGKNPSYFVGGSVRGFSAHAHIGTDNLFVLEGDEYPSSNWNTTSKFLHYNPHDVLLTSAEHDHVNVFPTHEEFLAPFKTLLSLIPPDGLLVTCADDPSARALAMTHTGKKIFYGVEQETYVKTYVKTCVFWNAHNIRYGETSAFDLTRNGELVAALTTTLLGRHNVQNVVGTAALFLETGLLTPSEVREGIKTFQGVERRLISLSPNSSIAVYEGFGSSYTKARAAIEAMKTHFPRRRLIVVFEPHTFSWRNRAQLHWYDNVFEGTAEVLVYEPASQGASTHKQLSQEEIVSRIKKTGIPTTTIHSNEGGLAVLKDMLAPNDVVLLLTSGDLGSLIEAVPRLAAEQFPRKL